MLFYTGYSRTAEKVAKSYVENIKDKEKQLKSLNNMVEQSIKMLREDRLEEFGLLMNESWYEKRLEQKLRGENPSGYNLPN